MIESEELRGAGRTRNGILELDNRRREELGLRDKATELPAFAEPARSCIFLAHKEGQLALVGLIDVVGRELGKGEKSKVKEQQRTEVE